MACGSGQSCSVAKRASRFSFVQQISSFSCARIRQLCAVQADVTTCLIRTSSPYTTEDLVVARRHLLLEVPHERDAQLGLVVAAQRVGHDLGFDACLHLRSEGAGTEHSQRS